MLPDVLEPYIYHALYKYLFISSFDDTVYVIFPLSKNNIIKSTVYSINMNLGKRGGMFKKKRDGGMQTLLQPRKKQNAQNMFIFTNRCINYFMNCPC